MINLPYLSFKVGKNDDIDYDFNLYYYVLLSSSQFWLPASMYI